jgi:hypothetical protein
MASEWRLTWSRRVTSHSSQVSGRQSREPCTWTLLTMNPVGRYLRGKHMHHGGEHLEFL